MVALQEKSWYDAAAFVSQIKPDFAAPCHWCVISDAFYLYIKDAVSTNKPYDVMAREIITWAGDSFVVGKANWAVGGTIPMGPTQDTYDGTAKTYGVFRRISHARR